MGARGEGDKVGGRKRKRGREGEGCKEGERGRERKRENAQASQGLFPYHEYKIGNKTLFCT